MLTEVRRLDPSFLLLPCGLSPASCKRARQDAHTGAGTVMLAVPVERDVLTP